MAKRLRVKHQKRKRDTESANKKGEASNRSKSSVKIGNAAWKKKAFHPN